MAKKKSNPLVNEAYKKHFDRVPVNIMKLPEIYENIEAILKLDGQSKENLQAIAFKALVEKYRIQK